MSRKITTAGELRGFLADVIVGIQDGAVDANKANAIAKVAAQINQSLATEVAAASSLANMKGGAVVAGSMAIATPALPEPEGTWCGMCEDKVKDADRAACRKRDCPLKGVAS